MGGTYHPRLLITYEYCTSTTLHSLVSTTVWTFRPRRRHRHSFSVFFKFGTSMHIHANLVPFVHFFFAFGSKRCFWLCCCHSNNSSRFHTLWDTTYPLNKQTNGQNPAFLPIHGAYFERSVIYSLSVSYGTVYRSGPNKHNLIICAQAYIHRHTIRYSDRQRQKK